jgi:hypothetical protein
MMGEVAALFEQICNDEGVLTMGELAILVHGPGGSHDEGVDSSLFAIFQQMDADGDGEITLDEFRDVAEQYPELLGLSSSGGSAGASGGAPCMPAARSGSGNDEGANPEVFMDDDNMPINGATSEWEQEVAAADAAARIASLESQLRSAVAAEHLAKEGLAAQDARYEKDTLGLEAQLSEQEGTIHNLRSINEQLRNEADTLRTLEEAAEAQRDVAEAAAKAGQPDSRGVAPASPSAREHNQSDLDLIRSDRANFAQLYVVCPPHPLFYPKTTDPPPPILLLVISHADHTPPFPLHANRQEEHEDELTALHQEHQVQLQQLASKNRAQDAAFEALQDAADDMQHELMELECDPPLSLSLSPPPTHMHATVLLSMCVCVRKTLFLYFLFCSCMSSSTC